MNRIIIKGRLTRDPEMKTGASGIEFCKFTVAVDRKMSKEKMKEKQADFFDCTAFGKTGAAIGTFLKKGREIALEGRLDTMTAPELEKELNQSLSGADSLTLDFSKLEYISSAGLRVLLSAHKMMNNKGGMKVTNVNEIVQEVFEVTGFADILNIER